MPSARSTHIPAISVETVQNLVLSNAECSWSWRLQCQPLPVPTPLLGDLHTCDFKELCLHINAVICCMQASNTWRDNLSLTTPVLDERVSGLRVLSFKGTLLFYLWIHLLIFIRVILNCEILFYCRFVILLWWLNYSSTCKYLWNMSQLFWCVVACEAEPNVHAYVATKPNANHMYYRSATWDRGTA